MILFLGNDTSPINYPSNAYRFRQDSNFLYYFGIDLPKLVGLIDIEGGKDILFADDYTMDDIIWMGPQESIASQAEKVGVRCTRPYKETAEILASAIRSGRKIHFLAPYRGEQILTLSEWLGIAPRMLKQYSSAELTNAVIEQRAVKEPCEIDELFRAQAIGYEMHVTAMKMAQPGQREQIIAGIMEGIAVGCGHQTSFSTILSMNGQILHNEYHKGTLERGRLLLVDAGAENSMHYASDNTRTTPVGGEFTQQQLAVYQTVLAAVNLGIEMAKPGVRYLDVHRATCRVLTQGLQDLGIMKGDIDESVASGAHALFLPHGLGHMMGLDTHDMEGLGEDLVGYDQEVQRVNQFGTASLRFGRRLQEGFVVTVEPGIYFIPELIEKWRSEHINSHFIDYNELEKFIGFGGIRLEDDIVITADGCKLIGDKRIPILPNDVCDLVKMGA